MKEPTLGSQGRKLGKIKREQGGGGVGVRKEKGSGERVQFLPKTFFFFFFFFVALRRNKLSVFAVCLRHVRQEVG